MGKNGTQSGESDREMDRWLGKLQVERHRWSRVGAWEMPTKRNDALGGTSLTF